jgi:hypothetical protein
MYIVTQVSYVVNTQFEQFSKLVARADVYRAQKKEGAEAPPA